MNKFTFHCDQNGLENTMTFECETWDVAVENFELFLRGIGYVFNKDATLQIVEPEEESIHSPFYFDTNRNR